jgi:hypothetical protein
MRRQKGKAVDKENLFIGIDLHKQRWHVTIRTLDRTKCFFMALCYHFSQQHLAVLMENFRG